MISVCEIFSLSSLLCLILKVVRMILQRRMEVFFYAIGFQSQVKSSLTRNSDWIIDTGVTDHMTYNRFKFDQLSSKCPINILTNAYGVSSPIFGICNVPLYSS